MAIPSEYAYLLDDLDFIWYGSNNVYTYESGLPMWYNAGWSNNPVSIENMSFATLTTGALSLPFNQNNLIPLKALSIYIVDNGGTVTCNYSELKYAWNPNNGTTYPQSYVRFIYSNGVSNNRLIVSSYDWANNIQVPSYQTTFTDLASCVEYIHLHFRHISVFYNGEQWVPEVPIPTYTSNGGGATHIAKVTGQLKDLSSNLSDILLVSGGGGGGLLLGDSGWHGTEEDIMWCGNNNKLTVQIDDEDLLFKLYSGSSVIYSFTSPVSDVSKVYINFLIDSENQVAKPSFIYETATGVYSYNQEEPTDEQMADIYTWLSAGLSGGE